MTTRSLAGSGLGLVLLLTPAPACGGGSGSGSTAADTLETDGPSTSNGSQTSGGSGTGSTQGPDSSGGGPATPLDMVCEAASALLSSCGDMLGDCDQGKLAACPEVLSAMASTVALAPAVPRGRLLGGEHVLEPRP